MYNILKDDIHSISRITNDILVTTVVLNHCKHLENDT